MKTKLFFFSFLIAVLSITLVSAQGHMWAITLNGGAFNQGAVIVLNNNGTGLNVAHSFNAPDGYHPYGNLLMASDGNLYGTCYDGGTYGSCTIFRLNPFNHVYTDVVSFDIIHGDYPKSGVVEGPNGKLYGAASAGGAAGGGVIYSYDLNSGTYTDEFDLNAVSGTVPYGSPIMGNDGKLYGMTTSGGIYSGGVIYSYDIATGIFTDEFNFNGSSGLNPKGSLIQTVDGTLYGMTSSGGDYNNGIIFSFQPSEGTFTKLYDMSLTSGSIPQGTLMMAANGMLYGLTSAGGVHGAGVLFSFNISNNVYTDLFDFNLTDGSTPLGSLTQSGSILCGSTSAGGNNGLGVMFNYDLNTSTYTKVMDFNGSNGSNPNGAFLEVMMTGLADAVAGDAYHVFPNPVTGNKLTISSGMNRLEQCQLKIMNVTGEEVYSLNKNSVTGLSTTIDLSGIPAGTYFVEIKSGAETVIKKFVIE